MGSVVICCLSFKMFFGCHCGVSHRRIYIALFLCHSGVGLATRHGRDSAFFCGVHAAVILVAQYLLAIGSECPDHSSVASSNIFSCWHCPILSYRCRSFLLLCLACIHSFPLMVFREQGGAGAPRCGAATDDQWCHVWRSWLCMCCLAHVATLHMRHDRSRAVRS